MHVMESIYDLRGNISGIRIYDGEAISVELSGGNVPQILETFRKLCAEPATGEAYILGILAALTHCSVTRDIPALENRDSR